MLNKSQGEIQSTREPVCQPIDLANEEVQLKDGRQLLRDVRPEVCVTAQTSTAQMFAQVMHSVVFVEAARSKDQTKEQIYWLVFK